MATGIGAPPDTLPVEITAPRDLSDGRRGRVREQLEKLARYTDDPIQMIRLTLRHPDTRAARSRWEADATLEMAGRQLAAHATAADPVQAAKEVAHRLRRQMRRAADADAALRNEPRVIEKTLAVRARERRHRPQPRQKPAELRDIIPQRTPYPLPENTFDAVMDLLDLDYEFLLFRHERTGEDVVVYRRGDGRIGLLHPPGSELAHETDIVIPKPSRYPEPVSLERVRDELAVLGAGFIYFTDERDGRGRVLYVRRDGDYGLVEPPPVVPPAS
jgi:ribosome-associated translation inhibitor RaiA